MRLGTWCFSTYKNSDCKAGCVELAPHFIGPFKVSAVVADAKLAYKLELPSDLRIHPVFHVSALKAYTNFERR